MISIKNKIGKKGRTKGMAIITASIFLTAISVAFALGVANPSISGIVSAKRLSDSNESLYVAESLANDMYYRVKNSITVDDTETLSLGNTTAEATKSAVLGGIGIVSIADKSNAIRSLSYILSTGSGASFHYGIQSGTGGIILQNSSSIIGNAYSNGPISGSGSNIISGDAISAGPNGSISGIHASGSAFAHSILDSTVDGDAYYQSISNTTVLGTLFPSSDDQTISSLPISDDLIDEWEQIAEGGGIVSSPCPYKITSTATIGPVKIDCDLEISGNNFDITLAGPVWVSGNITIKNSPTIRVDSSLGSQSVAIIADKISNRSTSGKIELQNSASFEGSGTSGSYVLFVSQNNSAENSGSEKAITVGNSVSGSLLVYAGHGEIDIENSVDLKEVTAYRVRLKNTAQVIYETGLASLLFSSGPGGGYVLSSWDEVE